MLKVLFGPKYICMRRKLSVVLVALFVNLVLFIYFAFLQNALPLDNRQSMKVETRSTLKDELQEHEELTIIIREFEDFENSLNDDIRYFQAVLGVKINILIVVDKQPYPPLNINFTETVKLVNLAFDLRQPEFSHDITKIINTKFSLFIQDGCRFKNVSNFSLAMKQLDTQNLVKAIAIQTGKSKLTCPGIEIDMKRWTVKIEDFTGTEGLCDFVDGDQAILIKTEDLKALASPFTRPVPKSIYFQLSYKRWKSYIFNNEIFHPREELQDPMNQYQHKKLEEARLEKTYKMFGIHQIIYNRNKHHYIGCTKDTERCFGSVIDDVPDYIYENRWTPPCCLRAIRETAIHVFQILEKNAVRYWLEGGSLLGAVRHEDIIPWDYDVDIGIYEEDINKCKEILIAKEKQYVDDDGFLWEKAIEGEFFRVHFSDINRNHVDIFPFYSKNGVMTKNTWFKTHPQDREFPEHYLKPLTNIMFIGRNVSAPNNVEKFLEFKFGKGVIEHPKYPNTHPVY